MADWKSVLLSETLDTKSGKKTTAEVLAGKKLVLIYFSAHWCPPCRGFTPVLAEAYKKYGGGDIEVIFVSSDRDESSFNDYYGSMPWAALPFAEREAKGKLSSTHGVSGIPTLIVMDDKGGVITKDGRSAVAQTQDLEKCKEMWVK
uniref:protein-disulfide reductase n=1 Tax=Chromera velia CCMP2878 TaxID=1169474 RepID=A0A0G4H5A4_9ALVE|mmetsp:Transcript_53142/g.104019  ORF Transcript_53142/g.104019 Transcript_53142/m.104019 type:complete len:146 (+) Transcript_53142:105-542(+)|eukprot:Cvel_24680.t1-p1 / transcript=Cvel_24680.t1 / gene=Cvel_24680 / organism=Chromera_velia_CCMP2878 / gene_product=Tryparedoxin, putative / transcript_product=Tryparedoxin, putative / location=Cvel_scaffold2703:2002-3794(+) / protein_length=145 / sequence_SO=supercontig / SO=protein_coding / is_pseudo=false